MKDFSIIVACDVAGGIGKDNALPWHLSGDMKHFKDITTAHYVAGRQNVLIMGRKTWESLPERHRPLSGRHNVVISSSHSLSLPPQVSHFRDFDAALVHFCHQEEVLFGKVFVIGGGQLFQAAMKSPLCRTIYLTRIEHVFECDCFFPDIPDSFVETKPFTSLTENGLNFFFVEMHKKSG